MTGRALGREQEGVERRLTILHVIESFGAGSANALREQVNQTRWADHILLRSLRKGEFADELADDEFMAVHDLPQTLAARRRAIRRLLASERIDVVHAHSSIAGAIVRLSVPRRRVPIVYSPHCFAFERLDITRLRRVALWLIEWLLATNTSVIAACSQRELSLAARLPTRNRPVFVPNVAGSSRKVQIEARTSHHDQLTIVAVGRLGPQKDPLFFADVVDHLKILDQHVKATWIGGGDEAMTQQLQKRGIRVTGWLSAIDVDQELTDAAVYMHTARWEGFPLSLLEAVNHKVPVVARAIPALLGSPTAWLAETSPRLAQLTLIAAGPSRSANLTAWADALSANYNGTLAGSMRQLYRAARS